MTPIHTHLYVLIPSGLWSSRIPDPQALANSLQRIAWVANSSWRPYVQAMPYVPGHPHWSWIWSEVVRNQIPFSLSPYRWLALGGPPVTASLYEVVPFVGDTPTSIASLPAWDALRAAAQKRGAVAYELNGAIFWGFKRDLPGVWAPSQRGEATSPYPDWEEEAFCALHPYLPEITGVRLMPGGALARLKPTGWRGVFTQDQVLQGLMSRVGVPATQITASFDTVPASPRAPGNVLVMDTSLVPLRHTWHAWLEGFEACHRRLQYLIDALKPTTLTWLLSGTHHVVGFTPEKRGTWPWQKAHPSLSPTLFSEPTSEL